MLEFILQLEIAVGPEVMGLVLAVDPGVQDLVELVRNPVVQNLLGLAVDPGVQDLLGLAVDPWTPVQLWPLGDCGTIKLLLLLLPLPGTLQRRCCVKP